LLGRKSDGFGEKVKKLNHQGTKKNTKKKNLVFALFHHSIIPVFLSVWVCG